MDRNAVPTLMMLQSSNEVSVDTRKVEDERKDQDDKEEPVSALFKPIDYNPSSTVSSQKRPPMESHEPSCSHLVNAVTPESLTEWPFPKIHVPTPEPVEQLTKASPPEALARSESKQRIDSSRVSDTEPDLTATSFQLMGFKRYSDDELQQEAESEEEERVLELMEPVVKSEIKGYFDL